MRDVIVAFLIGLILGACGVFVVCYGLGREGGGSASFPTIQKTARRLSGSFTSIAGGDKGQDKRGKKGRWFLGFEKQEDLKFFRLTDGLYTELTSEMASQGKRSLYLEFPAGASYPGLYWEVFNVSRLLDLSDCDYFGFDAFNRSQFEQRLVVKLKSGANYPKKVFERTYSLAPGKWTKVRIPVSELSQSLDPKAISYIKIFLPSPSTTVEVYLDGLGQYCGDRQASSSTRLPWEGIAFAGEVIKPFSYGVVSSVFKVIPKRSYLRNRLEMGKVLSLKMAKGEAESQQIVLFDVKRDVDLRIELDLKADLEAKIYEVRFVKTRRPYYPVTHVGWWPDPMLEVKGKLHLAKGNIYPILLRIKAGEGIKAGTYSGVVRLIDDPTGELIYEIPVTVKVWDFSIPKRPTLKTAFDVYDSFFAEYFPRKKGEEYKLWKARLRKIKYQLHTLMLEYRMSPMLKVEPTAIGFKEEIQDLLERGLNAFAVGRYGGSFGNNWPRDPKKLEEVVAKYADYAHVLDKMGLLDMAYIYTWDEGKIGDPFVAKVCSAIHSVAPGLRNMVCYHGFWDPAVNPNWGKDIDIWCFQIASYNRLGMRRLMERGMEVWMYVSGPDGKTPNLVIDSLGVEHRIIPWMMFEKGIKGFLYWAVNFWQGGNPWEVTFNTPWQQNGNGSLFYPYKDEIVPSIRDEIFRDGMEDYEYLVLLKGLEKKNLSLEQRQRLRRLLDFSSLWDSFTRYTHDGRQLLRRRDEIGEFLSEVLGGEGSPDVSPHR